MYDDPVSRALAVIRQHYDDGGDVEPLMSRVIEGVGDRAIRDKRVLEPEAVLKPGPEQSVWEKISSKFMGDRPSPERRRFVEGVGNIADVAHIGAYATPLAPAVGAVDFARGVASGDPMEAVLGATGLPGRAAKAAGVAASAMMPGEAEAGPLSNALKAIRAYHGSPHQFDKFDISKIGTGEGHQAYGHGLYFAENPKVAQGYRETLSPYGRGDAPEDIAARILHATGGNREAALEALRRRIDNANSQKVPYENLQNLMQARNIVNIKPDVAGHMYEVDIHADPSHMLDWDKPLSEQKAILDKIYENLGGSNKVKELNNEYENLIDMPPAKRPQQSSDEYKFLESRYNELQHHPAVKLYETLSNNPDVSGKNFYYRFGGQDPEQASIKLKNVGIPGIKYLDQGSRGSGEGTSNYVVFDPSLIEILRRYKDGGVVEREEKAGGGGLLKAAKDALLALHGMKSYRMDMAEKLGGLPVPSIAIAKPEHGFKRFGDITLVGGKEMATPSRVNPVYGSDVYSPRFPSLDDEGNRIFRGFTNMGNRRYAPLTMENVVREMKGNVRGGENYNYGAGNVRAAVTPQFKTLEDVQNARGNIVTSEEFEPHKRGAQDYLFDLADRFYPHSKYSGSPFQHAGSFAETLSDVGKGRSSAWSQDYKDLPDELKSEAMQYLSRLKEMPTEYFEAKPQRAVELGEFAGAVVPENLMNEVEARLKNLGVREVVPFNPEEEGAQQKAFREFSGLHFNNGGRANKPARI